MNGLFIEGNFVDLINFLKKNPELSIGNYEGC